MKLPILISVPHAGTATPDELKHLASIAEDDIIKDGDEQAAEVYLPLRDLVIHLVSTDIARAFVDLNRAPDDYRKDGVIKTHTCWDVPIYGEPPGEELVSQVLDRYYHPYHSKLRELAREAEVKVGIDCHTMAAYGPPVGPDPGVMRPAACVSDADGACDPTWTRMLAAELAGAFESEVSINHPFKGGYITREHAKELPWLQLEISRGEFASVEEKTLSLRKALESWSRRVLN